MASLPRPSRPSLNNPPPSAPPPSVPKSRESSVASIDRAAATSGASSPVVGTTLPQRLALNRTASNSSVSSIPSPGQSSLPAPNSQALQGRALRKTISHNSLSRIPPAAGSRTPSGTHSPTPSNNTTPRSSIPSSSLANGVPTRSTSLYASTSVSAAALASSSSATIDEDAAVEEQEDDESAIDDSPRGRQRPTSTAKDKGNVVISVRVRPEKESNDAEDAREWLIEGKKSLVSYRGREGGEYYYDNVFTTNDKNAKVYDSAAKRLVRRVMEGYNGTVFAYGITGTGKTFSMQGTATSPGVIPLAITDIFSYIRETPHREFLLRVSYLEIYNEKIFDLLAAPAGAAPGDLQKEDIKLREDNKGNVYATPLKEEIVQSPTQLLRVISRGDHHRRTHSTQFNARSSRSHAVVQIVVESRERNAGVTSKTENKRAPIIPGGVRVSTLSLIDLAGSERAAESKERRTEGAHINKSLLTLGTVISKLSGNRDKQGQPTDKDGKHLPYRDSKLTRLLQPALSGNSLISILCTIQLGSAGSSAAAGHHTIETLNTLKFAARARNNIVSHAKRAEEAHGNVGDAGSRALLDRYRVEILELRKQLEHQKAEGDKAKDDKDEQDEKAKEAEEQARHEEQMLEMQLARTALKERIEHLNRLILSSKSIGVNTGRSYSALNLPQTRGSVFGTMTDGGGHSRSIRSSASTQNFDFYSHDQGARTSTGSLATMNNAMNFDEEEDLGENGDGTASLNAQIRNLQADLADKNRYIATLEKRLLQARRSSRSRMSMTFANRVSIPPPEEGGYDSLLQDKDAEIAELREKLDDKDRMVAALRSAARKRDTADTNITSSSNAPLSEAANSSPASAAAEQNNTARDSIDARRRSTDSYRSSVISTSSLIKESRRNSLGPAVVRSGAPSPANLLQSKYGATSNRPTSPKSPRRKNHGVDEMTRMLDDMIRQKMDNENNGTEGGSARGLGYSNSLLNGNHSVSPLSSGRSSKRSAARRPSGDGSRLTGWEPPSSRNRSNLADQKDPKTPTQTSGSRQSQNHANGVSPPSTSSRPSTATPTQPSSRAQHQYTNSTAAASQAIEALRPNALTQRTYDDSPPSDSSTPTPEVAESTAPYADAVTPDANGIAESSPATAVVTESS